MTFDVRNERRLRRRLGVAENFRCFRRLGLRNRARLRGGNHRQSVAIPPGMRRVAAKMLPDKLRCLRPDARERPRIDELIFRADDHFDGPVAVQIAERGRRRNRAFGVARPARHQHALRRPEIDFHVFRADSDFYIAVAIHIADDGRAGNFAIRHGRPAGHGLPIRVPRIDFAVFAADNNFQAAIVIQIRQRRG